MSQIVACKGKVLVSDLSKGEQVSAGGIVIPDDDGTVRGIHARWAKVYAVGSDITAIKEGDWILVDHGRWSRGIMVDNQVLHLVDYPNGISAVADEKPQSALFNPN